MPKQQAWAINVSGGEPRLLGDVGCNEEGCEDLQISPDGKNVVWSGKKHLWIAPIGTGPFQLGEWRHNQFVQLKRFPRYAALPGPRDGNIGGKQALVDELDRKSTRLNSSHSGESRMPSSA